MKVSGKIEHLRKLILLTGLLICFITGLEAQEPLTLDNALNIAETGSPDLQHSHLNLERSRKSLEAQRAALKSRFSLDVLPVSFSRNRRFDSRVS
jgi:outer membrane protein TolC